MIPTGLLLLVITTLLMRSVWKTSTALVTLSEGLSAHIVLLRRLLAGSWPLLPSFVGLD